MPVRARPTERKTKRAFDHEEHTLFEKIRKTARRIATLGAGNCPRCWAPLTAAGNCPQLCGGA